MARRRGPTSAQRARASARVWLDWNGTAPLGRGRVDLLEQIERHGSISKAAGCLGISYRAAWKWVDQLNRLAGEPMVVTATGGRSGGGTHLTQAGKAAIVAFRIVEEHTRVALDLANAAVDRLLPARRAGRRASRQCR